ncbi:ribonuclease P 40kDa subunit-domain-containing protein [Macrophomina phaseolina]|uniref:Ribonuclease P 40kDa subunit-domain-containing protein n=1 Tax=Macrophomina phaseolina TaxID=35725 RepID=A0ABQ8FUC0_9PEZI|nr:ribonuclease P 40kDa subunit-domain-containing protein [Macrophomina phaseolina]
MLDIDNKDTRSTRCYFTHSLLGEHFDDRQLSTKKKPFATVSAQLFSHTADLILPDEVYAVIKQELDGSAGTFHYARVNMTLGELIDGEFFNHYIKTGNILMLSEGRRGIDNVFSLRDGVLRLELDRAMYERCGLEGQPIPHGGRKHTKERFAVELELRKPSMLHGKKGFERIVWAFKNVLNHSLTWLFHDVQSPDRPPSGSPLLISTIGPIVAHAPQLQTVRSDLFQMQRVQIPALTSIHDVCDPEYCAEVLEWFGMVSLGSPRIDAADSINSFLSCYEVPMPYLTDGEAAAPAVGGVVRLRWRGLVPSAFLLRLWIVARKGLVDGKVGKEKKWMAMSVAGFGGEAYTMLGVGGRDVLSWECR